MFNYFLFERVDFTFDKPNGNGNIHHNTKINMKVRKQVITEIIYKQIESFKMNLIVTKNRNFYLHIVNRKTRICYQKVNLFQNDIFYMAMKAHLLSKSSLLYVDQF